MKPLTPGERALASYLDERGLSFEREPFPDGPNPDFLVTHPVCGQVVMEVAEPVFRLPRNVDGSYRSGSYRGPAANLKTGAFDTGKRKQAAVARDLELPFVLVFARSNSEMHFDSTSVMEALFGNVLLQFPTGPDGLEPQMGKLAFGAGAQLQQGKNTRYSAAAVLTEFNPGDGRTVLLANSRCPEGAKPGMYFEELIRAMNELAEAGRYREDERVQRLAVYLNPFAEWELNPRFLGPRDDLWRHDGESAYIEAAWGVEGQEVPGRDGTGAPLS